MSQLDPLTVDAYSALQRSLDEIATLKAKLAECGSKLEEARLRLDDMEHESHTDLRKQLATAQAEIETLRMVEPPVGSTIYPPGVEAREVAELTARVQELEAREAKLVRALERLAEERATMTSSTGFTCCSWCGQTSGHSVPYPTAIAREALGK